MTETANELEQAQCWWCGDSWAEYPDQAGWQYCSAKCRNSEDTLIFWVSKAFDYREPL